MLGLGKTGRVRRPVPEASGAFVTEARGGDPGQRGNKWWTLVAVCLGTFMLLLDITIVNVALPAIQTSLHSSFAGLQWVVDAYALSSIRGASGADSGGEGS